MFLLIEFTGVKVSFYASRKINPRATDFVIVSHRARIGRKSLQKKKKKMQQKNKKNIHPSVQAQHLRERPYRKDINA